MTSITMQGTDEDAGRDESVISLTHYPMPDQYAQSEQEAREARAGPHPYGTVEAYYASLYGAYMVQWRGALGNALYYTALTRTALAVSLEVDLIEREDTGTEHTTIPLMVHFIEAVFFIAVAVDQTPSTILLAVEGFKRYIRALGNDDDLSFLTEPLIDPIAELEACQGVLSQAECGRWIDRLHAATQSYAIPIRTVVLTLQHLDEDSTADEAVPSTAVIDLEKLTINGIAIDALAEASGPSMIEQLDGSMAPSAETELRTIFRSRRPCLSTVEEQLADTLAQHSSPYREALALWWKLHRTINDSQTLFIEARLLDSAGQLLQAILSPEAYSLAEDYLPIDELINQMVSFIAGNHHDIPRLTWPQVRISLMVLPIGRVAQMGKIDPITYGVGLFGRLGWEEDIPLLKKTMEIHGEAMEQAVRRTLTDMTSSTRRN